MEEERYLTPGQVANQLGVSRETVRDWLKQGKLEGNREVKGNGQFVWKVPREAVEHKLAAKGDEGSRQEIAQKATASQLPEFAAEVGKSLAGELNPVIEEIAKISREGAIQASREAIEAMERQLERERERADRLQEELDRERGKGFWARWFGR